MGRTPQFTQFERITRIAHYCDRHRISTRDGLARLAGARHAFSRRQFLGAIGSVAGDLSGQGGRARCRAHRHRAYTCNRPGYFTTIAGLESEPTHPIYYAGEHTNSFYEWQGFMEGAALSGLKAAKDIVQAAIRMRRGGRAGRLTARG